MNSMDLLEHEGKELMRRYGLKIPKGSLARSPEELMNIMDGIDRPVMAKVQVPTGGRGKAGGILRIGPFIDLEMAQRIFAIEVKGLKTASVLVEEEVRPLREWYLAIIMDRDDATPKVLFGTGGGIDVESKAKVDLVRLPIDHDVGIEGGTVEQIDDMARGDLPSAPSLMDVLEKAWSLFWEMDCELVEINPLFVTANGELISGDAKVILDDDALSRHPDIRSIDLASRSMFEEICHRNGFVGVELKGDVAVIANGAGLTMAVLDSLKDVGLDGACFLDLGGSDDVGRVELAISLTSDVELLEHVKCILVCIFGGITSCDVVALGIIKARDKKVNGPPIIVRLRGRNEEAGRGILLEAGIRAQKTLTGALEEVSRRINS